MIRSTLIASLAALSVAGTALLPAAATVTDAAACWGRLTVAPGRVAVGSTMVLTGQHYSCKGPAGFLPRATVMFYQPHYGFAMFVVHPRRDGTYRKQVTVPKQLRATSDINGGGTRMVPTRLGRYYFWITLFDVSVVPPSRAIATVRVVAGPHHADDATAGAT